MVNSTTPSSLPNQFIQEILSFSVDEKGYIYEADRDTVLRRLRGRLDNRQCFDCESRNPTWLSMTYAVFICLTCSGKHRRMGTHISFVRSSDLDKFTREQLIRMEIGGNGKALTFFKSHGIEKPDFHSKLAVKYKGFLDKECLQVAGIGKGEVTKSENDGFLEAENSVKETESFESLEALDRSSEHPSTSVILQLEDSPTSNVKSENVYYITHPTSDYIRNDNTIGVSLESALTHHASVTGGITGVKQVRAKKLDSDFDFDEALEEAASVVQKPSSEGSQLLSKSYVVKNISGSVSLPCVSHSVAASNDATAGLSSVSWGRAIQPGLKDASSPSLTTSNPRYATLKAISSADLCSGVPEPESFSDRFEMDAKYRRFNGCKAISSEAFHAGDPSLIGSKNTIETDNSAHLSQLGEQARQGITILASGAQQTITKARNWINNFIFEEKPPGGMYR